MDEKIIHNDTVDTILSRRTVRSYKPEQISDEELNTVLTAGLWAPSARNKQPCHIRALQNTDALREINTDFKNLVGWDTPAYTRWNENPVYHGAPTLLFIFADEKNGMDGGIMTENMVLAAESIGLSTCIIGSIGALMDAPEGRKWKKHLKVSEDSAFIIAIALGYKAETPPVKPRKDGHIMIIK